MKKFAKIVVFSVIILICSFAFAFSCNINEVFADVYATSVVLQDEIDAATSGDTITITGNVSFDSKVVIDRNLTIKFNSNSLLKRNSSNYDYAMIEILSGVEVTIDATYEYLGQTKYYDVKIDGNCESGYDFSNENYCCLIKNDGTLNLNKIQLQNNNSFEGAGIYNNGTVNLFGCTLNNLTAKRGGAFFNKGLLSATDCIFAYNNAYVFGGAGYSIAPSTAGTKLNMQSCSLFGNEVLGGEYKNVAGYAYGSVCGGAAIAIESGISNFENCTFTGNIIEDVKSVGGAILLMDTHSNFRKTSLTNCNVYGNKANNGGAITVVNGELCVLNGSFYENQALNNAGAIYVNNGKFSVVGTTFYENTSKEIFAKDVYLGLHLLAEGDEISGKFLSENQTSIIAEGGFCIGEEFEIAEGGKIIVNQGLQFPGYIYIKAIPQTQNILIRSNRLQNNQRVAVFANNIVANENIFNLTNKRYSLQLVEEENANHNKIKSLYSTKVEASVDVCFKLLEDDSELLATTIGPQEETIPDAIFEEATCDVLVPIGKHIVFIDVYGNELDKDAFVDDDIIIYVDFEYDVFEVKFFIDGVQRGETLNIQYGLTIYDAVLNGFEIPIITAKTGYHSLYWVKRGETQAFDFEAPITENVNIDAYYLINKYTIKFYADSNLIGSVQKEHNSCLTADDIPAIPTKVGYTQTAPYFENLDFNQKITQDKSYSAKYTINTYTVVFIVNGQQIESQIVEHGQTVDLPTLQPAPVGYTQTQPYWSANGQAFDEDSLIVEDLIITEVFTPNSYEITFKLNYVKDFGQTVEFTSSKKITKTWQSQITEQDLPTFEEKEGYGGQIVWQNYSAPVEGNREIVGTLNKDVFSVTFKVDGIKYGQTLEVEYNNKIDLSRVPPIPEKLDITKQTLIGVKMAHKSLILCPTKSQQTQR